MNRHTLKIGDEAGILRKLHFQFFSHWIGYDSGDSFLSENRKENCHHGHIPFNLKGNGILVFSVYSENCRWSGHMAKFCEFEML